MKILLVEDNPDEEELALLAFERHGIRQDVRVARDGQEALDLLLSEQNGTPVVLPRVVFLDINLPKLSGLDVLRQLRGHQHTALLPVVLLTSSDDEQDRLEGYRLGANSYIRKNYDFNAFLTDIRMLGDYWLDLNRPPYE